MHFLNEFIHSKCTFLYVCVKCYVMQNFVCYINELKKKKLKQNTIILKYTYILIKK